MTLSTTTAPASPKTTCDGPSTRVPFLFVYAVHAPARPQLHASWRRGDVDIIPLDTHRVRSQILARWAAHDGTRAYIEAGKVYGAGEHAALELAFVQRTAGVGAVVVYRVDRAGHISEADEPAA